MFSFERAWKRFFYHVCSCVFTIRSLVQLCRGLLSILLLKNVKILQSLEKRRPSIPSFTPFIINAISLFMQMHFSICNLTGTYVLKMTTLSKISRWI